MSNLGQLLRVSLRESLDLRKNKKKSDKQKSMAFTAYIVLIGIVFTIISFFYNYVYMVQFKLSPEYESKIYLFTLVVFGFSMLLTFTTSMSRMQSVFVGKDYELLASLPIRKRDIILSKIFTLYLVELFYSLLLLVPNGILASVMTLDFKFLLVIVLAFVSPAYSMLVALLVTALINTLIRNKKVRDIISGFSILLFFIAIIVLSISIGFVTGQQADGTTQQVKLFAELGLKLRYINPSLFFVEMGFNDNILWLLLYIASNLILLVFVLSIVCVFYNRIHQNMNAISKSSKIKSKYKIRSQFNEIMHSTNNTFFRSKTFLIQTGIGLILSMVMGIAAAIIIANATISLNPDEPAVAIYTKIYNFSFVVPVFISMFSAIVPPSSVAISLEGESFFMLKSMPIDFKKYIKAKLLFSTLILTIPMTIVSIVFVILVPQSVLSIIISLLFPFLFGLFTSIFTLFINIKYPYLHYENEIEVFKNHKSSIITAFFDMILATVTFAVGIILSILISPILAGVLILAIYILLNILFIHILFKNGVKALYNLEDN